MSHVFDAIAGSLRDAATYSLNDTLMPRSLALNASEHVGDGVHLACIHATLAAAQPVAVVGLGGSISAGSSYSVRYGGSGAWLYHAKVAQALRSMSKARADATPPQHRVAHHNGALPATGPAFFEHCVEGQLRFQQPFPNAPRLVLVEFGVNTDGQPAAFERLLRKLLAVRPVLSLLVVNTHVWTLKGSFRKCWKGARRSEFNMTEPHQLDEQTWEDRFNFGDEDAIARLCQHYDVPLVSMRSALLATIKANRGPKRDPTLELRHFMIDCKHPSGQGHTYLAQMVLARLLRDFATTTTSLPRDPAGATSKASSACAAAAAAADRRQLPPPVHSDGYPRGTSRCVNGAQMQTLSSLTAKGFEFTGEGRGKLGWVGRKAGDELSFCLVGNGDSGEGQRADVGRRVAEVVHGKRRGGGKRRGVVPRSQPSRRQPSCDDAGEPGSTAAAAQAFCARMRAHCGEHTYPKLLKQCRESCGMCLPASRSPVPGAEPSMAQLIESADVAKSQAKAAAARVVGLWLGYLQSYEHMGRATIQCAGACACAPSEIDAHAPPLPNTPRVSITAVRRVTLRLPPSGEVDAPPGVKGTKGAAGPIGNASLGGGSSGCCRLTLRIQSQSSSGEHKFKLLALLLAEARESDNWQPPGLKVGAKDAFMMMHRDGNDRGNEAEDEAKGAAIRQARLAAVSKRGARPARRAGKG